MNIKQFIKDTFPSLVECIYNFRFRERSVSYGTDNPDKVFYVFGMPDNVGGMWWHINKVLMHLGYAKDKGYIPVIDMKNYENQYIDKENVGRINVWEIFFDQPAKYTLEDIQNSKNIILSKYRPFPFKRYEMGQSKFYDKKERIQYFHQLFNEYIHFNNKTQHYFDLLYDELFRGKGKILGVLCRGTDYVLKKPVNHPIQPRPEDVINDAKQIMQSYSCDHIFIATEDQDILDMFKKEFGDKLMYVDQTRSRKKELDPTGYLSSLNIEKNRGIDPFSRGIGYLSAIYLLSKCDCFLAGRTGGCKGVLIMSEGFEYKKIYDLGYYQ